MPDKKIVRDAQKQEMRIKMKSRKDIIYELIGDDRCKAMKRREMAVFLRIPKGERQELYDILDELCAEGKAVTDKRGRYRLPEEHVNVGVFMATTRGFGFVRIEGQDDDVFIPEPYCGSAYDGDLVKVQVYRESGGRGKRRFMVMQMIQVWIFYPLSGLSACRRNSRMK